MLCYKIDQGDHVAKCLADGCSGRALCSGFLSDWEQYLDMISDYTSLVPFMTQEGVRAPPFLPPLTLLLHGKHPTGYPSEEVCKHRTPGAASCMRTTSTLALHVYV